jgi:hypothetical protein
LSDGNVLNAAVYAFAYFINAQELDDVKHVGAFAFADYGKAEGIHDVAHVEALLSDPTDDVVFGSFRLERGECAQTLY